ncbi:hypothetical protein ABS767_13565 [Sphingomonas sp. ST-64]|uniref:Las17-binding protein actin regulator n=1 Tax=Sphingomonas plantiphila TaxID=3163295 RepID=A0ABW8YQU7_9SPHN
MIRTAILPALALLSACGTSTPEAANEVAANASVEPAPAMENGIEVGNVAETPAAQASTAPLLNLAPGGLTLIDPTNGRARQLTFGTERAMVMRGAEAALGAPDESGRSGECGEGAMDFAKFDGLRLWFQGGKLVGWFLDGAQPKLTTGTGAGIGSTRAQVADGLAISDVPESSLGREFTTESGSFSGLLDGPGDAAKVTTLWSGHACIFR